MPHPIRPNLLWTLALLSVAAAAQPTYSPKAGAGPHRVVTLAQDWTDTVRGRTLPVNIDYPADLLAAPAPVIVFSHGLGGTRDGYDYLARHWAGCGYIVVRLQHPGSDDSVWKGLPVAQIMPAMRKAANARTAIARLMDVRFAVNHLREMNAGKGPLAGRLDLARLGMAGHSYGAWTTLGAVGLAFPSSLGGGLQFKTDGIEAAIAMSAPAARPAERAKAYAGIDVPIMHMTGRHDDSPIGDTKAADRRIPFDHIDGPDQYLLDFNDADHMTFSGRRRLRQTAWSAQDPTIHGLILQASTAFWDAYLRDDAAAMQWLKNGGLKTTLGGDATLEEKQATGRP